MIKRLSLFIILLVSCLFGIKASEYDAVVLQTDRYCYISGDVILLKTFLPFNRNQATVYVDLTNEKEGFIKGEILHLEDGVASGFLQIPDTVKTGNYVLRVYTYQSKTYLGNKILGRAKLYITNRFGNNSELYETDDSDTIGYYKVIRQELKVGGVDFSLDNDVYDKRSKVSIFGSLLKGYKGFNGVVSVKPTSGCELVGRYNNANCIENKERSQDSIQVDRFNVLNENKGIIVSGVAKNKTTGRVLDNLMVILGFEDSILRIKHCKTDSIGKFSFLLTNCFEVQEIYLTAFTYPGMELYSNISFELDHKFISNTKQEFNRGKVVGYQHSSDSLNLLKSVIAKAYKIDYQMATECYVRDEISYEHMYIADEFNRITNIDDFVSLPDFYQIAREILPFVKVKEKDGTYEFILFDGVNSIIRHKPMVFVDGIPLNYYSDIMKWGSDKIKTVQVKVGPRYFGDLPFEQGLVLIWTRKIDFWQGVEYANTIKFTIPCYQKKLAFEFPDYSKQSNTNIPDFRQVLYWNPDIEWSTSETFEDEFYTSDESGLFEICLSGITDDGKTVYIRKYFEVK